MECRLCNQQMMFSDFYFRKETQSYRTECKKCFRSLRKKYRNENSDTVQKSKKTYYYNNQEVCCERSRKWYNDNKLYKNEKHAVYIKTKRQTDISFKMYSNIQNRIYGALKSRSTTKETTTLDIIGCSIGFYKNWLEYQFDNYMNWDNHGVYWHIDHVKPCSSFDLTNQDDIKKCFNWSNVRPIEKTINLKKNDKIDLDLIRLHNEKVKSFMLLKIV